MTAQHLPSTDYPDVRRGDRMFEYMRLRVAETPYLDSDAEWKIVDQAVFQWGIMPHDAKCFLNGAAVVDGFSTETLTLRALRGVAAGLERSGRISRNSFKLMIDAAVGLSNGALSQEAAAALCRRACDAEALLPARRGLSRSRRWYRAVGATGASA